MPFVGKVKYILKKYGWEAVFTVYLVCLLGSWIYLEYVEPKPILSIEMIDGARDSAQSEAFEGFMEQEGYVCTGDTVKIGKSIQIGNGPDDLKVSPNNLLFCKVNMYNTDLYFWDDQDIQYTLAGQDLMDLREILPEEVLKACEERLIYTGPILKGGYPCGIHLENCEWVAENGFYQDCAVGISRNVQNPQLVSDFIQYIL